MWHGQEVGEVGPIKPLPKHVRQEPYSLPQGFHWTTLSSSIFEEVVKFINKYNALVIDSSATDFHILTQRVSGNFASEQLMVN